MGLTWQGRGLPKVRPALESQIPSSCQPQSPVSHSSPQSPLSSPFHSPLRPSAPPQALPLLHYPPRPFLHSTTPLSTPPQPLLPSTPPQSLPPLHYPPGPSCSPLHSSPAPSSTAPPLSTAPPPQPLFLSTPPQPPLPLLTPPLSSFPVPCAPHAHAGGLGPGQQGSLYPALINSSPA